jgi:glycine amidinotransferase
MPRDQGMIMDAANVCRLGDRMLFLESASGNRKAYEWLCDQFPNVNIELCNFYSGVHIDSTIVPLRDGLVLLNASRVTKENCPQVFKNWDKIWFDDCVAQGSKLDGYASPCSSYIGMNILSVDPNTVICDSTQIPLMRELEKHKNDCVPVQFRHAMTLSGGIHCATLDLRRRGTLESYCD